MFGLYITHPQVQIDPDVPVPQWGLSDLGRARTGQAAAQPWAATLGRIVSSDETKAIETANLLATAAGLTVEIVGGMHENDRSATGFLPPMAFEEAADWFFAHPDESFRGWERATDAQARIVGAVDAVLDAHDPSTPIAFVGHGGVGTLLKCHLMGRAIGRDGDQPAGGGNLFAFDLANGSVACDWTPMEDWQGWVGR
ncbi:MULTISPECIES: histidine phosphatase family protein [Rhizobium]|uniref:Phosphoglycerate mutase family protein n=1 Tax=Rhizobium rhododendri TaxID=2506430 RepID=A0ABY8IIJ2_9HYPH|nr:MULTISPECIES: histidine phosphatase family protein [Rhizobium]MBZ5759670.1 phosphoglycerate mutase family protein [Rhizobium sp. VS19-DR96]MBZ5766058.1 phosphoglycerate mutase family protein [Rhizobium sp. VS19-DR129.2]MBZ5772841.1 phosphoglycerate mutase family protein [Rhizobium sp. VS19-DRK62.2]MBZ5786581.1 phosphoglycerate mutase family protein [Rhizobium sp. VS19-DR121]MBZ5804395.1 phosphoglycerate mutase family protein [Rhizobium sp. VS19-DR181]